MPSMHSLALLGCFAALATAMYDCNNQPIGMPVPDENTIQLPKQGPTGYLDSRCYPLCLGNEVRDCTHPIPVCFGFQDGGITFDFSASPGLTYESVRLQLEQQAPNGDQRDFGLRNGCQLGSKANTTVSCTLPYNQLVVDGGSSTNASALMCPDHDAEGWTFKWHFWATLRNNTNSRRLSFQSMEECDTVQSPRLDETCPDCPDCPQWNPFWELYYRCSKCLNSGLPSPSPSFSTVVTSSTTSTSASTTRTSSSSRTCCSSSRWKSPQITTSSTSTTSTRL